MFGEVQSALNAIWKAKSRRSTMSRLLRARLASFGLVITLGFVLMVSLALSAALTALGKFLQYRFPVAEFAVQATDFVISVVLISGMFAVMYKVLPDTPIRWRDVAVGALMATGLFEGGKYLIALYIGQTDVGFELRGRRRADRAAALDLLFDPDLPAGRGVHAGLDARLRLALRRSRRVAALRG